MTSIQHFLCHSSCGWISLHGYHIMEIKIKNSEKKNSLRNETITCKEGASDNDAAGGCLGRVEFNGHLNMIHRCTNLALPL